MFTRNYYNCVVSALSYKAQSFVDTTGTSRKMRTSPNEPLLRLASFSTSINDDSIVAGTGTETPTIDDYYLSGDIITTLTCLSDIGTSIEIDGGRKCVRTLYLQNTGTEEVTIGEIAWLDMIKYSSTLGAHAMLDRTVLDTPLTIPAGQTGKVEYEFLIRIPDTE